MFKFFNIRLLCNFGIVLNPDKQFSILINDYKIPVWFIIFKIGLLFSLVLIIYLVEEYDTNNKNKEFYKSEYNYIITGKVIYPMDHETQRIMSIKGEIYIPHHYKSLWSSIVIGDSLVKEKESTTFQLFRNKNFVDSFISNKSK